MQRFARLKQVELELQPSDDDATIEADVLRLLFALASCIEYCVNKEPAKGRVLLRPAVTREEAVLEIANGAASKDQAAERSGADGGRLPPELSDLEPVLGSLGARIAFANAGAGTELQLILPLRRGEN